MKLVLKDNTEIEIASMLDNYNAKDISDNEKRSATFTIQDPSSNITIEYLADILTTDNLSDASIVSNTITKNIVPSKVSSIGENITDDSHFLTVRVYYL